MEEWFPASERADVPEYHQSLCGTCPVRIECLQYAITTGSIGIWGGTNTAQRNALVRKRAKAKCPVCRLAQPVHADLEGSGGPVQLCLGCGASWDVPVIPGQRKASDRQGEPVAGQVRA